MSESEINARLAPPGDGRGENALNIYTATETLIKGEVWHVFVTVCHF